MRTIPKNIQSLPLDHTSLSEYTLLFQPVPTNDRGWVEFNNGANLGIRISKGTLERNRYHNSLVV
jgi:hypothetical protein